MQAKLRSSSVLITGSAGFIGGRLVRRLVDSAHGVVASVDRESREALEGETFIQADLSDPATYAHLPTDITVIYHLAAQSSARVSHEQLIREVGDNIMATLRLLEFARKTGVKKVVFASSMAVYGDGEAKGGFSETDPLRPTSNYGVHKIAAEQYLDLYRQFGLKYTSLRLFNVYGPGQDPGDLKHGLVGIYLHYIDSDLKLPITGSLDRYRDFVYVDDVVDAFMLAGSDRETDNQVFNVATGVRTTVRELIDLLSAEYGFAAGTYPVTRAEGHPGDIFGNAGATGKLEALGWEARYDLTAGIQRTVDWLRHPGGRGT